MAYQTGTATSPIDLLNTLRLFCIAQGITVNEYVNDGTYQILSVEFGSGFFTVAYDTRTSGSSTIDSYILTQYTSWNSGTSIGSQPNDTGISNAPQCNFVTGAISEYHFFYFPGGMLYASFQMAAGNWSHFGMGDILKQGTYTGGACILGNYIATSANFIDNPFSGAHGYFALGSSSGGINHRVRCDQPNPNTFYRMQSNASIAERGHMSYQNVSFETSSAGLRTLVSSTTQATSTQVQTIYVEDQVVTNRIVPIGELPDLRIFNMRFFNAGDTYDDDWLVFPISVKRDETIRDNQINTGEIGVALRFQ